MIIDGHTHILPSNFRLEEKKLGKDSTFEELFSSTKSETITGEELIQSMNLHNIKKSVVLGYGWNNIEVAKISNNYNLKQSNLFPERIIPFCSINPNWGNKAMQELERCLREGARGIGELHPTNQFLDLKNKKILEPMMTLARSEKIPVTIHGSEPVGHKYPGKGKSSPKELFDFIELFPDNIIILAHWGGGLLFYELMKEVKKISKNVFYDTATTSFLYESKIFKIANELIGSKKIIFGTDHPLLSPKRILNEMKELTQEDIQNITYKNVTSILNT